MNIKTVGSGSEGNCYLVEGNRDSSLLLDAGVSFKLMQKAIKFKTFSIKGVLITHEHMDHAGYIKEYMKNGLEIYMTQGTKDALQLPDDYRIHVIDIKKPFVIDDFKIMAIDTIHDAREPCGYVISHEDKKLLYATDTMYLKYKIPNLTHIMLEANYEYDLLQERIESGEIVQSLGNRIMKTHMSLDTAIKYLNSIDKSKLETIIIIHLSKGNAKRNHFKERLQSETGKIIKLASQIEES